MSVMTGGDPPCMACGYYHSGFGCPTAEPSSFARAVPVPDKIFTLKLDPTRLHPDDIEAIAKRVVELMRAP